MVAGRPIHILLVEDSKADIMITQEHLNRSKIINQLTIIEDGLEALDFLHKRNQYVHAVRPDLILLDLNLPGLDGHTILKEVKGDAALRGIPVVIMTSSDAQDDIESAYQYRANCYVKKPIGIDEFSQLIGCIEEFWFTVVKLPPNG